MENKVNYGSSPTGTTGILPVESAATGTTGILPVAYRAGEAILPFSLVLSPCLHECRTGGNGRDVRCPSRAAHLIAYLSTENLEEPFFCAPLYPKVRYGTIRTDFSEKKDHRDAGESPRVGGWK